MPSLNRSDKDETIEVTVSSRTIIRTLVLILLAFLLITALRKAAHALTLIFTGIFLAIALNAPVHWLAVHLPGKTRGSRSLATIVSFLVVFALLSIFVASIVPPLVRQTSKFIHEAPGLVQNVTNQNSSLGQFVRNHHLEKQVSDISSQLNSRLGNVSGAAFSTITRITSSIFSMLVIFVVTFMALVEGPRWFKASKRLIPDLHTSHVDHLISDMYKVVRGYVNGQIILAAIAAALIVVPLLILNIGYPVALMVVVFISALIPMIGHPIGAVIVTTVALFHSPIDALIILLYYILYIQVENYVIQPRIQSTATQMSPLLVFVSVLIGVTFDGLVGGLVAIPVAGCLKVLVLDYLTRRQEQLSQAS